MKPRKRYNYVYVVHTTTFYQVDGVEYPRTPYVTDYDVCRSYGEAKTTLLSDFQYWCDTMNPSKVNIKVDEPSRRTAGDYYLDCGGYRCDGIDRDGKPRARVGRLYRFRY